MNPDGTPSLKIGGFMIVTKRLTIDGKYYQKTWSDIDHFIEREGILYSEAIDPWNKREERVYTETEIPFDPEPELEEGDIVE